MSGGTLVQLEACREVATLSSLITRVLPISTKFESKHPAQRGPLHMPVYINSGCIDRGTQTVYDDGVDKKGCLGNPEFMLGLHRVSFDVLLGLIAGLLSTSTIYNPRMWLLAAPYSLEMRGGEDLLSRRL